MPPFDYSALDVELFTAIKNGANSFSSISCSPAVKDLVKRAQTLTGRDGFRVLDGRLQTLRRTKQITYTPQGGWVEMLP